MEVAEGSHTRRHCRFFTWCPTEKLDKNAVPALGQPMGTVYMDAVRTCLGDDILQAVNVKEAFDVNVLHRFKTCHV